MEWRNYLQTKNHKKSPWIIWKSTMTTSTKTYSSTFAHWHAEKRKGDDILHNILPATTTLNTFHGFRNKRKSKYLESF